MEPTPKEVINEYCLGFNLNNAIGYITGANDLSTNLIYVLLAIFQGEIWIAHEALSEIVQKK